jgi:hypothetical protein
MVNYTEINQELDYRLMLQFTLFESVTNYFASFIDYEVAENAPDTFEGIKEHYENTGKLLVWNGASDNTIFSNPQSNYAFRAWHDFCHIKANADFTPSGERDTMLLQIRMVMDCEHLSKRAKDICTKILQVEVLSQLQHALQFGDFPENQRHFAIDKMKGII